MLKKIILLAIAVVMTVSVVGGCEIKTATPVVATTNGTLGVTQTDQGFVPKKDLSLTIWSAQDTDYVATEIPEENVVSKWLTNKTKVSIENIFGNGGGSWDTKLTQLLAADNLPELLRVGSGQGPAHHAKLAEADKIWELKTWMIQKYAPDIWEKVPKYMWDKLRVNDKIYGIPANFQPSKKIDSNLDEDVSDMFDIPGSDLNYVSHSSLWIRDDILKKIYPDAKTYGELVKLLNEKKEPIGDLLLDVPIKSTQNYIDFFYKIKDLSIKEGEELVYPFGYNGGDNWMALSFFGPEIMGTRGYYYTGAWDEKHQKIILPLIEEIDKECARIQNKMIRDKVIEPESIVHSSAEFEKKVLNGLYAVILPSYVTGGDMIKVNAELRKNGKNFHYRPLISQLPNRMEYPVYYEPPTWNDCFSILKTVKEEDIPQILNWMNVQYTDEFEDAFYWGPKEEGLYEELEDGKRKYKDEKMQKFLVDGGEDGINGSLAECKGLANKVCTLYTRYMWESKYNPKVLNKTRRYLPRNDSGFKFKSDSPHVTSFKAFPPCQGWSAEFSDIPEVKIFWEVRQQWENPFKLAFVAKSDEEFEQKWNDAIDNLKSFVDIDSMLEQMTQIARVEDRKLKK